MLKTPFQLTVVYSFFLFISIFFLSNKSFAQKIRIIVPEQIEDHLNKKEVLSKEAFLHYPFNKENVNLRNFKRQNPLLALPDAIKIILPDLTGIQDTSLLIGYLNNGTSKEGHLVVLVVGNYESNEVTFFADTNFDGDYRNDEKPFILIGGAGPTVVFLQPPREQSLKLTLSIPKRLSLIDQKLKELDVINKKFKRKINRGFSLGVSLGLGAGKLTYEYDNIEIGYPTWYNVRFTGKTVNVLANYDFSKFRIGISATLINSFYYTSYFNMRLMEPMGIRTGVLTERNIDQHALNRVNLGATVAYKINLSRFSSLNPFFTYGQNFYLSKQYFSDFRPNKEIVYNLSPNRFLEYGVQLEFAVGNQRAIVVDLSRNQLDWKPDDFLAGIDYENLKIRHYTWKIALGYKFGL